VPIFSAALPAPSLALARRYLPRTMKLMFRALTHLLLFALSLSFPPHTTFTSAAKALLTFANKHAICSGIYIYI
jgi:hypothetical protein